jgi:2-succinyl-5-enolpyruvyl-6-hydroxy-3-cyclohexene-1-carboxylate synthase
MADHLKWTSHLFRAFYKEGVSQIYISPGSRSAPLALAAAIHPGFVAHVVVDERSAAFQALGSGKASGVPAILICTSGTALANYHPAVIEAKHAGVPLIVLSADRPPHLRGTGSSQTIDQIKLFSDSAVMFHELGEPVFDKRDLSRLELLAKQAVQSAIQKGGAVHLNAPFRKPLEPSSGSLQREENLNRQQVDNSRNRPASNNPSSGQPSSGNPVSVNPDPDGP